MYLSNLKDSYPHPHSLAVLRYELKHFAQGYWGPLGNQSRLIKLGDGNSSPLENSPDDNNSPSYPFSVPNPKQIPKEVADIFNAPSDDEEFVGFRDDVPMETLSSEESCDSFDSLGSGKQVGAPPSGQACSSGRLDLRSDTLFSERGLRLVTAVHCRACHSISIRPSACVKKWVRVLAPFCCLNPFFCRIFF